MANKNSDLTIFINIGRYGSKLVELYKETLSSWPNSSHSPIYIWPAVAPYSFAHNTVLQGGTSLSEQLTKSTGMFAILLANIPEYFL